MDHNEAIAIFEKKFPKLTVTKCINYDEQHFVIEAVENVNRPDYNDPYYGVDKKTGKITGFIPTLNLDAFFDAVETRLVYSLS